MSDHDDDELERVATNMLTTGIITFFGSLVIRRKSFSESLEAGLKIATLTGGAHVAGKLMQNVPGLDQYDNTAKLTRKAVKILGDDILDVTGDA